MGLNTAGQGFMEVEMNFAEHRGGVSDARRASPDLRYVPAGIAPDVPSTWLCGRWQTEQFLLVEAVKQLRNLGTQVDD